MNQFYTTTDHFALIPAIMLALFGCAILLFDFLVFPHPKQRKWLLIFVVLGLGFATLRPMKGTAAMTTADAEGIEIAFRAH